MINKSIEFSIINPVHKAAILLLEFVLHIRIIVSQIINNYMVVLVVGYKNGQ